MGNRKVLTASGAVKIEHRLGQIGVTIRRAQEAIKQQKNSLCDDQAARLDAIELSLNGALASAKLSIQLFKAARPELRPMDAAEQRLIEEFADSGLLPKRNT